MSERESATARFPESACSLGDPERRARIRWVEREILPLVLRREALADGFAWECSGGAGAREALERWIALETDCCRPIAFELTGSEGGRWRLAVRGSDPAVAYLAAVGLSS